MLTHIHELVVYETKYNCSVYAGTKVVLLDVSKEEF